jgi:hypothetical protein
MQLYEEETDEVIRLNIECCGLREWRCKLPIPYPYLNLHIPPRRKSSALVNAIPESPTPQPQAPLQPHFVPPIATEVTLRREVQKIQPYCRQNINSNLTPSLSGKPIPPKTSSTMDLLGPLLGSTLNHPPACHHYNINRPLPHPIHLSNLPPSDLLHPDGEDCGGVRGCEGGLGGRGVDIYEWFNRCDKGKRIEVVWEGVKS